MFNHAFSKVLLSPREKGRSCPLDDFASEGPEMVTPDRGSSMGMIDE
jgi:hypothetical protein